MNFFLVASRVNEKADKVKKATFQHVACDEVFMVFNTFNFNDKETFDTYMTDLKNEAGECEFEHLADSMIRNWVMWHHG